MRKIIIAIFIITCALSFSCEEDVTQPTCYDCLPIKIIDLERFDTTYYEYEGNKLIKNNQNTTYEYDDQENLVRINHYYNDEIYTYTTYEYISDEIVKWYDFKKNSITSLQNDFELVSAGVLEYNSLDQLINSSYFSNPENESQYIYLTFEYDELGNLQNKKQYIIDPTENFLMLEEIYEHGNNNYYFKNVKLLPQLHTRHYNNILKIHSIDYHTDNTISERIKHFEYVAFNKSGYPTKYRTRIGEDGRAYDYEIVYYTQ